MGSVRGVLSGGAYVGSPCIVSVATEHYCRLLFSEIDQIAGSVLYKAFNINAHKVAKS